MRRAFAQINLAVLLWGFTGIFGKLISLSAPVLVWYRMGLAVLFLSVILSLRRQWIRILRADLLKLLGIGVLFAIHWVAFYGSVKLANASIAMVCLATASVFTALLDPLLNKKPFNRVEIVLGAVAVMGVAVIYLFQPADLRPEHRMVNFQLGLLLGLLASVISSLFTVLNKPLADRYPARPLVFYEMSSGWLFLSLLAPLYFLWKPGDEYLPQGFDYLWLFLLAYCCTVWAQALAMSALKHLSPFTVTLSVNLEPIYGIVLAFLIFQENAQLGLGFYAGVALIFASLIFQVLLTLRKSRASRRPVGSSGAG